MVVSYMDFFFYLCLYDEDFYFFFFFQAEDGIRDGHVTWSSDVCSSDLSIRRGCGHRSASTNRSARPGMPRWRSAWEPAASSTSSPAGWGGSSRPNGCTMWPCVPASPCGSGG